MNMRNHGWWRAGWTRMAAARMVAVAFLGPVVLSACVNILVQNAPGALRTAESRAKFELDCPNVQASILSQKTIEGIRFEGSEHTIGVRGCGKQVIYETYCRDADNCNALSQGDHIENAPGMLPGR